MNKKKIVLIVGTRPEVIKMAPVYLALKNDELLEPVLVSTGQHREMLDQAFSVFGFRPHLDLGLMTAGQTLSDITAKVISGVGEVLNRTKPTAVLVQGDTATVLGASLAAFYNRVPIGHIEAGLRTGDLEHPWPEEMVRRLTDPICRWCFAPTEWSANNLRSEGVPADRVYITGNTVIDALLWVRSKIAKQALPLEMLARRCSIPSEFVERYIAGPDGRFVLVTGHRRESFGRGFEEICTAIRTLAEIFPDLGFVYPVHLNPAVQEPVRRILGGCRGVLLTAPVSYEDFIALMDRSYFVMSDSGGVQEEAPSLGKPVLVLRATTERPEGVQAGTCTLVGTRPEDIIAEAKRLLTDHRYYATRAALKNPYGCGDASSRIVDVLKRSLLLDAA